MFNQYRVLSPKLSRIFRFCSEFYSIFEGQVSVPTLCRITFQISSLPTYNLPSNSHLPGALVLVSNSPITGLRGDKYAVSYRRIAIAWTSRWFHSKQKNHRGYLPAPARPVERTIDRPACALWSRQEIHDFFIRDLVLLPILRRQLWCIIVIFCAHCFSKPSFWGGRRRRRLTFRWKVSGLCPHVWVHKWNWLQHAHDQ